MKSYVELVHTAPVACTFRQGDEVVLAEGTYQGTLGVFIHLRMDVNWAEVEEQDGRVRSHPVAWLALALGDRRIAG
jgi:transcription antitermination factor NusG